MPSASHAEYDQQLCRQEQQDEPLTKHPSKQLDLIDKFPVDNMRKQIDGVVNEADLLQEYREVLLSRT